MRAFRGGLLVLALVWSGLTWAQEEKPQPPQASEVSEEDREKARMYYELAAKHYEDGELIESAQMLEKAYAIDADPVLAYNIGKAYDEAAELELALVWYRKAEADPELGDKERVKTDRAIARIEKTQALIAEKAEVSPPEPTVDPTFHAHDGFFLRLSGGMGFSRDGVEADNGDAIAFLGLGGLGDIAIGYTIASDLALHLDIFGGAMIEPVVFVNDKEVKETKSSRLELGAVGVGLSYYLLTDADGGLLLSGALGAAVLSNRTENSGVTVSQGTEAGFGLNAMCGYEWWISHDWGIGVAGQVVFATVPSEFKDNHGFFSIGAVFSATYN